MTPSPPDPRIVAAAQADDVREFSGMARKHSRAHYSHDDAPSPGLTAWVIVFAAIVIGAIILGVMTLPATPAPYVGPGFEAACRGGC
ncbi:MAG: hypothetical protein VR71_02020 [Roseovarius sp. BRH_c41]|uniref:hypothetical protein n=1 Tax=Roseovarius sp. BRH_c41 TaxID=1629709 RepID=UPI0005F1E1D6|nr:hypothetical protein [Roseovarius sp. BRH_c41]KJS45214.1 MAG: hypothetical protein VR71_02020 [Roseovarius sp. BRH_c41]